MNLIDVFVIWFRLKWFMTIRTFKTENKVNNLIIKILKLKNSYSDVSSEEIDSASIIDHHNKNTLLYSIINDIFELRYLYYFRGKNFNFDFINLLDANKNNPKFSDIEKISNYCMDLIVSEELYTYDDARTIILKMVKLNCSNLTNDEYIKSLEKEYVDYAKDLNEMIKNDLILESIYYSTFHFKILFIDLPFKRITYLDKDKVLSERVFLLDTTINIPEPKDLKIRSVFKKTSKVFDLFDSTGFVPFRR